MKPLLPFLALLAAPLTAAAQPVPPTASPPALDLEQRMLLRCSAAFALVADRQQRGEDWALRYPPMNEIGQDFFVAAMAQVQEGAGISDDQVSTLLREEAETLLEQELLPDVMPVCLRFLEPSGL